MKLKLLLSLAVVLALGAAGAWYLSRHDRAHLHADDDHAHGHGHAGHADHADEPEKGPHGGRLLRDGIFHLELAIVERGLPPEFRAWFRHGGQPLAPGSVKLTVTLARPGGVTETFTFAPEADYARGSGEVREPHSFDYTVVAEYSGRTHRWTFSAPEMQATLPAELARRAGVAVEPVAPATLRETIPVYGRIALDANRTARAAPRFTGLVRETRKALGDTVAAGEVLGLVETNDTLAVLEVKAPLAGTILERHAQPGETVAAGAPLYTLADLSQVWLELDLPPADHARIRIGHPVTLSLPGSAPLANPASASAVSGAPASQITAPIVAFAPFASPETQSLTARVVLANPDGHWRPGLFVQAHVTVAEFTVPVAVRESALQTLDRFTVVFTQHGDVYQARPLELGRRSGGYVEVLRGLAAGETYVTANSFLLKAEIGKAGASHDH